MSIIASRSSPSPPAPAVTAPRWALVSLPPGARPGDGIAALVDALAGRGLRLAGFRQSRDLAGGRRRYLLHRVGATDRAELGRRGGGAGTGEHEFCNCVFRDDAFPTAHAWLAADAPGADLVVLDELSRLEATGGGHAPAIALALASPAVSLLSVRADRLAALMERFGLDQPLAAFDAGTDPGWFADQVARACREPPSPAAG